jgi:hypothetical protein
MALAGHATTKPACRAFRSTKSIRYMSFFEEFSVPLVDVFAVVYLWSLNKPFSDIVTDYIIAKNTVANIISKLRLL